MVKEKPVSPGPQPNPAEVGHLRFHTLRNEQFTECHNATIDILFTVPT
jgi:hypothetical protein